MTRIQSWNIAQDLKIPKPFIEKWKAEIYFLLECGNEEDFQSLKKDRFSRFSHKQFNMAIVSQFDFLLYTEINHPCMTKQFLECQFKIENQIINFYSIHLLNPINDKLKIKKQADEVEFILERIRNNTKGKSTIVIGDFNSRSTFDGETEYTNVIQKFQENGFVDSVAQMNKREFIATKIDRSNLNKRIDFCLLSKDLIPYLKDYGVQITDKSISDHRAIWVDFDFTNT